jgi:hypothetical protein
VSYIAEIEHRVAGIPCLIGVISYETEPQTWDDPGYTEMEWDILDRRGRLAPWLERKVTAKDEASIEEAIYYEMEN